jgi:hypothetical protein
LNLFGARRKFVREYNGANCDNRKQIGRPISLSLFSPINAIHCELME